MTICGLLSSSNKLNRHQLVVFEPVGLSNRLLVLVGYSSRKIFHSFQLSLSWQNISKLMCTTVKS